MHSSTGHRLDRHAASDSKGALAHSSASHAVTEAHRRTPTLTPTLTQDPVASSQQTALADVCRTGVWDCENSDVQLGNGSLTCN